MWAIRFVVASSDLDAKAQLQWLPGWKFPIFVDQTISKIDMFAREVFMEVPRKNASPRLNEHAMDTESVKYKSINLEQGWIVKSDSASSENITWNTREIRDCRNDLQQFAYDLKNELKIRFKNNFPRINNLLHNCLNFGRLVIELCGKREAK